MEVIKFTIEESKVNKGYFLLIAHTEKGKYVCSGDHWNPSFVIPYEDAFDFKTYNMATNVTKVKETKDWHTFSYRDEYNDEKLVDFPALWMLTEQEAEDYLNY